MKWHALVILLTLSTVVGCSTPKAALEQANNTVALTASLQAEMQALRDVQARIARSRLATIQELEQRIAKYEQETAFDDRVARLAGRSDSAQLFTTLIDLADSRKADEAQYQERIKKMKEQLDVLLVPIPDVSPKLATVQKAMAAIGTELSTAERVKIVSNFASELRDEVKNSKKDAEDALEKAEAAAVSSSTNANKNP